MYLSAFRRHAKGRHSTLEEGAVAAEKQATKPAQRHLWWATAGSAIGSAGDVLRERVRCVCFISDEEWPRLDRATRVQLDWTEPVDGYRLARPTPRSVRGRSRCDKPISHQPFDATMAPKV